MEYKTNVDFEWAENETRKRLNKAGHQYVQGPDWIAKNPQGEWEAHEVKYKEFFEPGDNFPHWGAGLSVRQAMAREQMRQDLGIRTKLWVYGKGVNVGEVLVGYIDELQKQGGYHDTRNDIRIYPTTSYSREEDYKK
ncbi:hypothetical protein ACFLVW_05610 [Chloroflexota bacterium]